VQRLGRALRLLQRGALGQLGAEHERAKHVSQLLDPELVLEGLHSGAVHDDTERLEPGGEAAADLFNGAQSAIGGGNREQARLGDDRDTVTRSPGGAGQCIERRRAVDEHEVVVGLDVGQCLLELPDLANARMRSIEVDR